MSITIVFYIYIQPGFETSFTTHFVSCFAQVTFKLVIMLAYIMLQLPQLLAVGN